MAIEFNSIGELLGLLKSESPSEAPRWYRGQSNADWKLLPTLARRGDGISIELDLLARFKQNASLLLQPPPDSDWGWLTVMQHYRVPTRLLDWTESPLVALYFAVQSREDHDGALWMLNPAELNMASNILPDYAPHIPSLGDQATHNYRPSSLASEQISRLKPIAVISPRNTPRMQAQLSVFTITHRDAVGVEDVDDGAHVHKFKIPNSAKSSLREELTQLAITRFQLFPELQSLSTLLDRV